MFPQARIDAEALTVLRVGPIPTDSSHAAERGQESPQHACRADRRRTAHELSQRTTEMQSPVESPMSAHLDGDLIGDCLELRVSVGEKKLLVSAPTA